MEQTQTIENKSNRKIELDILKGIGIIFVVIGHAIAVIQGEGHEQNLLFKIAYSFHMPLLIAISGYLTGISKNQNFDFNWIKKKTLRLLVPNFIWTAFVILVTKIDFITYMFVNPFYWFLPCLWVFNVVLYISKKTKHSFIITSLFFIFFFLLAMLMKNVENLFYRNLFLFFWYFFAGYYLCGNIKKLVDNKKLVTTLYIITFVLFCICINFACFGLEDFYKAVLCNKLHVNNKIVGLGIEGLLYLYNYYFLSVLGITMFSSFTVICIGFINSKQKKVPLFFKLLSVAGNYSLQIYVIHMFFIRFYTENFYANCLLSFGLGLIVPVLFGYLVKKIPLLSRILFG